MPFQMTDTASISAVRATRDGYLTADVSIARTGIQNYSGSDFGRPHLSVVRVLRPEDEVFDRDAMASFAHRPVTIDHPGQLVSANNWRAHAVGLTGDKVVRDGSHIQVPLALMDRAAIDAVQAGKRELSCGYTCEIEWTSGVTDAGEAYDAVQRKILGNHVAVVDRGRAGASCRIGDSWTTETPTSRMDPEMPDNLRTVQVDGISIQTTDQGAQMIERLQGQLNAATAQVVLKDADVASVRAAHTSALQAKDGEMAALSAQHRAAIEAKDGEIAAHQARIPDAVALDGLLAERSNVIDSAGKILGSFDPKGKSAEDIRRMAVVARLKDAATGKSDEWIGAAFTTLTAVTGAVQHRDPLRDAMRTTRAVTQNDSTEAHAEMQRDMANAWKRPPVRSVA